MTLLKSSLFLVGAAFLVATAAGAADETASGVSVARELVSREGGRFLFTVTPPAGRSVDPRVFDLFEIEEGNDAGPATVESAKKAKAAQPKEVEALDLSDYSIKIDAVATANSCKIKTGYVKYKKVNLSGGRATTVTTSGAASVYVSVYPVSGDVDALTVYGPSGTLCSQSIKPAGQFDLARCVDTTCNASGGTLVGVIVNPESSTAQFVGAVAFTYAQ